MSLTPFFLLFRDIAERETRSLFVERAGPLPRGKYTFMDCYCVERHCNCRRVLLFVYREGGGTLTQVASISHAFDRPTLDSGENSHTLELGQTFLDPLNKQSRYSQILLDLFLLDVLDAEYQERLERHYYMVKDALRDPAHEIHRILNQDPADLDEFGDSEASPVLSRPAVELDFSTPLDPLFGSGLGAASVEPTDERFELLFENIEIPILEYYESHPELNDGLVALTLERLGMNPAMDPRQDALCQLIQANLRITLRVTPYSKHEVKQAMRKISKSLARHTRSGGINGYLDFIRNQLSPMLHE